MRIDNFGDNLIQLTRMGAFSCYLVREDDGFTLVDTGLAGSASGILEAAHQADGSIRRIVLTHPHGDHVGSLDELHTALPGIEVMLSRRSARLMARDFSLDPNEPQSPVRGSWPIVTTQPTKTFEGGDQIGSLQVILSPGHTPGHVSFLDTRDGTLIAGDAFSTQGGTKVSGDTNFLFPFLMMATWHKPTALASAHRLLDLHPERLAVGHGPVLFSPVPAMEQAIQIASRHWKVASYAKA
jgi:glyoxylase-like metal-dependent hydrolase (beta-lactamase superfamily II)